MRLGIYAPDDVRIARPESPSNSGSVISRDEQLAAAAAARQVTDDARDRAEAARNREAGERETMANWVFWVGGTRAKAKSA